MFAGEISEQASKTFRVGVLGVRLENEGGHTLMPWRWAALVQHGGERVMR
jgi:hypothetical protein